jgi:hypothetical protein
MEVRTLPTPSAIDWESAAGPVEGGCITPDQLAYTYRGGDEPHWLGQSCCIVGPDDDESTVVVRFACGCRAAVPTRALDAKRPAAERELVGATTR